MSATGPRSTPRRHVAAVERRHGNHVEDGEQDIQVHRLTEHRSQRPERSLRKPARHRNDVQQNRRNHGENQVTGRPRRGNEHVSALPVPAQPGDVDRYRLGPAKHRQVRDDGDQRKHDRADRVDMNGRVQRDAAEQSSCRIPEPVGGQRVGRFVDRQGKEENE